MKDTVKTTKSTNAVVLNVWVASQTWVAMGPRMGREGTPIEQCLVAPNTRQNEAFLWNLRQ